MQTECIYYAIKTATISRPFRDHSATIVNVPEECELLAGKNRSNGRFFFFYLQMSKKSRTFLNKDLHDPTTGLYLMGDEYLAQAI